ncbi:DUF1003 domain-containing protein [Aphanothece hegewaldii CCALA 016]|uniref:DUF1003 domain-containing protein n=1 Tax=Aphanothece hegewaldii CCALA 016 TaxID=2107694 RepID=A0A2T1M372_9CHRO|nr:DUF1003 domain-containing protein [Aphanothece hegewaldii]PSF39275.1 DUF1003 domain-containing protein [Aphanothece hegewaldii CCALA 016]
MTTRSQNQNFFQKSSGSVYIEGEKYPLPQQVIDNIETIIGFQAKQEQKAPRHEQLLHQVSAIFGKSNFLYAQLIFFAIWIALSYLTGNAALPFNFPKYNFQDQTLDMAALLISTGVLVRQSHQENLAEQRSHLMLQINLLTEQKTAKIIALLEEMRTDLPNLKNRYDWEAEIMKQSTDPQVVLNILEENLNSVSDSEELPNPDSESLITQS